VRETGEKERYPAIASLYLIAGRKGLEEPANPNIVKASHSNHCGGGVSTENGKKGNIQGSGYNQEKNLRVKRYRYQ
jgi:hypothetical protein